MLQIQRIFGPLLYALLFCSARQASLCGGCVLLGEELRQQVLGLWLGCECSEATLKFACSFQRLSLFMQACCCRACSIMLHSDAALFEVTVPQGNGVWISYIHGMLATES